MIIKYGYKCIGSGRLLVGKKMRRHSGLPNWELSSPVYVNFCHPSQRPSLSYVLLLSFPFIIFSCLCPKMSFHIRPSNITIITH